MDRGFLSGRRLAAAAPAELELHVTDTEDRALDGLFISLAGPETKKQIVEGGVRLPLPPGTVPGTRVRLHVHEKEWVLISPWNGELPVPAPGGSAIQIILARRGDKQTLASGSALHAIAQRIVTNVEKATHAHPAVSDDVRRKILAEQAADFGFTPKEVDAALRSLSESPVTLEERRLVNRYLGQFPIYIAGDVESLNVTVQQARPKFVLDGQFDSLGLGARTTLVVHATPPEALAGARCTWSFDPPDILRPADAGSCIDVVMPTAPLADRGSSIAARASVRIEKDGEPLDELIVRGSLHNGVRIEVVAGRTGVAPGMPVKVKVVRHGSSDPIPAGFQCLWNMSVSTLFTFTPSSTNGCEGTLAFKPESQWSQMEGMTYAMMLQQRIEWAIPVHLQHATGAIYESETTLQLMSDDPRDPNAILEQYQSQSLARASGMEPFYAAAETGLPPIADLNETTLSLGLTRERKQWEVVTRYVGNKPTKLKAPLDEYSGLIRTFYSSDGQDFSRVGLTGEPRDVEELAKLKHLWVKFESPTSEKVAGPFRLTFDFEAAARAEVLREWRAKKAEDKQLVACHGLVMGGEHAYVHGDHNILLAAIDEISVGRDEKALWRTQRYGSSIDYLSQKKFPQLRAPVGPSNYLSRIRFYGGAVETYPCKASWENRSGGANGHYHRLARTTKKADGWPDEIEIYLADGWSVDYDVDVKPAAVRFSTDGKNFRTVADGRRGVSFDQPDGNRLVLRFVTDEGQEVEYAATIDFGADQFTTLKAMLFDRGKLTCSKDKEGNVVCGIRKADRDWRGGYYRIDEALPVLRSVAYGCSRDRLDQRDTFASARKGGHHFSAEFLFDGPRACETVFARFTLENGSESALLVAPVSTEDR